MEVVWQIDALIKRFVKPFVILFWPNLHFPNGHDGHAELPPWSDVDPSVGSKGPFAQTLEFSVGCESS